jgi:Ca-activated chloride channel family protein
LPGLQVDEETFLQEDLVRRGVLACVVCLVCVSTLLAQISLDVSLVTLVATVSDRSGRSIPDLGASDFIVIEDGKEQNISLVEQSTALPLSIGILLDASYSMEPKIHTATAAIDRFLDSLGPTDDVFLMSFSAKPKVEQNFTSDRKKISKALHKVKLGNRTALYDTIEQGIQKIRDGKHEKKALLLVTDGQDTVSRIRLDQAMRDVRESHVLLYCLGIGADVNSWLGGRPPMLRLPGGVLIPLPGTARHQFPSSSGRFPGDPPYAGPETADMRVLNMLASASGAKAWQVTPGSANSRSIDEVLDEVGAELRSQYTIGYYPNHPVNDGKWHQVVVRAKNSSYEVRSRKEYYGGQPGR